VTYWAEFLAHEIGNVMDIVTLLMQPHLLPVPDLPLDRLDLFVRGQWQRRLGEPPVVERQGRLHRHPAAAVQHHRLHGRRQPEQRPVPPRHQPLHRQRHPVPAVLLRGRLPADVRPQAGQRQGDTYTVVNELSGKCLDVSGASTADGAAVIQYTCNGATNQQFTLNPVTALGNSHDYQLVAVHSGKCVDVSNVSTTAGALIHQWTCDAASVLSTKKNQIWRLLGKS